MGWTTIREDSRPLDGLGEWTSLVIPGRHDEARSCGVFDGHVPQFRRASGGILSRCRRRRPTELVPFRGLVRRFHRDRRRESGESSHLRGFRRWRQTDLADAGRRGRRPAGDARIAQSFRASSWVVQTYSCFRNPYLVQEFANFDSYFKTRNSRIRKTTANRARAFDKIVENSFRIATLPEDVEAVRGVRVA